MTFNLIATATAIAGLLLGIGWFVAGGPMLQRWGIAPNPAALLVGRRLGAVYLGIAVMLFFGRAAPPSALRTLVCVALLVALSLLALLGLFELKAGRARRGILVAVVLEALLAAGFAAVLLA
ncbi:MAG: hypothetical protein K2X51_10295 [Burkholderiales bacterium]|nr:hypothetical protein [Burkholderiales bacterium]